MNSIRIKLPIVILLAFNLVTAWAAAPSTELAKLAPENTLFLVSCSGGDNLKGDFENTLISKIFQDPQVKTFTDQVKTALTIGEADFHEFITELPGFIEPLQKSRLLNEPLLVGGICDNIDFEDETVNGCIFIAMSGGAEKRGLILEMVKAYLAKAEAEDEVQINNVHDELVGTIMQCDIEDARICMGGTETHSFITLGNGCKSTVYLQKMIEHEKTNPQKLPQYLTVFDKFTGKGNDIKFAVNIPECLVLAKEIIENPEVKEELESDPKGAAVVAALIETIEPLGVIACRFGFNNSQFEMESVIENFAELSFADCFKPYDTELLSAVPENATEVFVGNLDVQRVIEHIRDYMIEFGAEDALEEIAEELADAEEETGINIRQDILFNITGEFLTSSNAASTGGMMSMASSSVFAIVNVRDCDAMINAIETMLTIIAEEADDEVQIRFVKTENQGMEVLNIIVPQFAMMGLQPAIIKADGEHLVIGTTSDNAIEAVKRFRKGGKADNIYSSAMFQKVMADSPANPISIHFINTEDYWKAANTQLSAMWPMLTMGASQAGIVLPPMLPNISHLLEDAPGSITWEYFKDGDLVTYSTGDTANTSMATVGGAALGVSILMPALSRAKYLAKATVCQSNLEGIGMATVIYMNDNKGVAPDSLEDLTEVDLTEKSMICPECEEKYTWCGMGLDDSCSFECVFSYCTCHTDGPGYHVLFADAHVSSVDEEEFIKIMQKNNVLRKQDGLEPIEMPGFNVEYEEHDTF